MAFGSRVLGPYELRGELGRGAMACVWRAWDPNLEREVAIKEPMFDERLSEAVLEELGRRFVSEGRTQASLSHPNIVTIYAADVWDGRPAIVMELVDGETLASRLSRGPMTATEALPLIEQLLDAVGYAHEHGVIHRDIKPENIFVTREGRLKLADFGIARAERSAMTTMGTVAGAVLGTPGYMSPEQAVGEPVDARSDIFSVGVVAQEMLTGTNPFGAGVTDATTLIYRIVHEPPMAIPDVAVAGIPVDLRPAIMCAMAKNPNDRPQSASEFAAMLRGEAVPRAVSGAVSYASGPAVTASAGPTVQGSGYGYGSAPIEQRKSVPSWFPYAAVVGVAAIVLFFVLGSALKGGGGGAAGGSGGSSSTTSEQAATTSSDALYYVGISKGHVAIFSNSSSDPIEVGDAETSYLSSGSKKELKAKVGASSYDEAKEIADTYSKEAEKGKKKAEQEQAEQKAAEEAQANSTAQLTVVGADGTTRTETIRRQGNTERVFADSNSRALTDEEIYSLSDAERCVAWNEIIAASSGYQFMNSGLSNYFYSCSWYTPRGGSGAAPAGVAGENVQRLQDATSSWWKNLATY